jgi:hypothetical protein
MPNDCWLISKEGITLKNYFEIEDREKIIDFYSGIIFNNKKVATILTNLRTKLIRIIYGCGTSGAHQSYLIDAIFDGTYYFYDSAKLRLKNLVAEISKSGISISRKKNHYFYDFDKNDFDIIFPCVHSCLGPLIYLSKTNQPISRKSLATKLCIKPSTASLYLKKWKEKGLIQKDDFDKYGEFKIEMNALLPPSID